MSPDHRGRLRRHGIRQPAKRHRWTHRFVSNVHRMCNLPATLIRAPYGVVPYMQATASAPGWGTGRERFPAQSAPGGHGEQACNSGHKGNHQSSRSDRQLEARLKENAAAVATAFGVAELRINDTLVTHLPCLPVRVVIPCARDRPQLNFHPRGGGDTTAHLPCTGTHSCSLHRGLLYVSAYSARMLGMRSAHAVLGRTHRRGCHN